jgi:DNA polymerase
MDELRLRAERMTPAVCEHGRQLVWGEGPLSAKVAIVGEAPGDKEEKLRKPFVGPAGRLLDIELAKAGLRRSDMWLTNIVKCRPVRESSSGMVNRPPTLKESQDWLGPIIEELEIIDPKIVLCLGAVAANTLIHKNFALTKERGLWFEGPSGIRAIATFHPAYVLRQIGESWNETVEAFRRDLREVAEELERLEREPRAHM